jgi:hypothetical protein
MHIDRAIIIIIVIHVVFEGVYRSIVRFVCAERREHK